MAAIPRVGMRSPSSSSSRSGTSRSQAAVAAMSREKPTRPSWKRSVLAGGSAVSGGPIRPARSRLERGLLEGWIARARPEGVTPAGYDVLAIPASRRRRAGVVDPRLEATLAMGDDPLLAPLRAAWLPAERNGVRAARLSALLTL